MKPSLSIRPLRIEFSLGPDLLLSSHDLKTAKGPLHGLNTNDCFQIPLANNDTTCYTGKVSPPDNTFIDIPAYAA